MSYGSIIPGLQINGRPAPYGVVNERAVRATAGTMMLIGFITFMIVYTTKDFVYLYPVVVAFRLQFLISTVWWPRWAPFSMLGRWMVRHQQPEYIGAIQKRFAWSLGLLMATAMLIVTAGFGMSGIVPFVICMTCLTFMWMESALGICVWCKIYYALIDWGWISPPDHRPACPGGVCEIKYGDEV